MRLAVLIRLLMLITCVVPFTSTRQAMAAVALNTPDTALPLPPSVPIQEEEDTEREEEVTGKEKARSSPLPSHRTRAARGHNLYAHPTTRFHRVITSSPSPLDPFRNGLGCPFRC
jgi:hypothetical protein